MSEVAKRTNLFLTGMMGTGKTSTGRLAATELRYVFADTDKLIELREEMTITEIFAKHGEKYFRTREREILNEICSQERQVIATGGGMLAQPENLELAQSSGLVMLLVAPPGELAHRLRYRNDRPLLATSDPAARLAQIESERSGVFQKIVVKVDTSGLSPLDVSTAVVTIYRNWLQS
jgi:shikimate kinase